MLKIVVGELIKLETLPGPLLVDNMGNDASTVYGSFPDRLYILLDGRVVYQVPLSPPPSIILNLFFFLQGGVGPHGYVPAHINTWLLQFCQES